MSKGSNKEAATGLLVFGLCATLAACDGESVAGDGGATGDAPGPDAAAADTARQDTRAGDLVAEDSSRPDVPAPDLPPLDLPLPDSATPDLPLPDSATPDLPLPDSTPPDLLLPDSTPPDLPLPDSATPDAAQPDLLGIADGTPPDAAQPDGPQPGAQYYVANNGSDTAPGTKAQPFATLGRARDEIRALKQGSGLPPGGVVVWIRGGAHYLTATLALTSQDSGKPGAPVVYQAYPNEQARLVGGEAISGFAAVTDAAVLARIDPPYRKQVLQLSLKARGITALGNLQPRGFCVGIKNSPLELFFDGEAMQLARWPNTGWATVAGTPAGKSGGQVSYSGDRPKRWTKAGDAWVHGFWYYNWADSYHRIKAIDSTKRVLTLDGPQHCYGYLAGQRYYALNLLEELDQPGEYYVDRSAGVLYFWPPKPLSGGGQVQVSMIATLVSLDGASHVTLAGLILEAARGTGVTIKGGVGNLVAGCTLRNMGGRAVSISGGSGHQVLSCDIHHTGEGGVSLNGGDRKTLQPGKHTARNNHIWSYNRWGWTYRAALQLSGVGQRLEHNKIHDGTHNAIQLSGNDHQIEFNEVHHVCTQTGDVGAFYMGRDWTMRGTVLRHNYFHHISSNLKGGARVIYFDDGASGQTVYGNIFYKVTDAIFIGGGRDNLVQNNLLVEASPSIRVDARGLTWAASNVQPGGSWKMHAKLKAVAHDKPPYSTAYPKLATITQNSPATPLGNQLLQNVLYNSPAVSLLSGMKAQWLTSKDNWTKGDPLLVNPAKGDFRFQAGSPVFKLGIKQIPADKIGLYKDGWRSSLP